MSSKILSFANLLGVEQTNGILLLRHSYRPKLEK